MADAQTRLYIDGQNFLYALADILKAARKIRHKSDIKTLDVSALREVLADYKLSSIGFYSAKVQMYDEYPTLRDKTLKIMHAQKELSRALSGQGVDYIVAGQVRMQEAVKNRRGKLIRAVFREKGVDVRLATDMLDAACEKRLDNAIILSSDSDMLPIITELKKRNINVIYLGVEGSINESLITATHRTITISAETAHKICKL